LGIEEEDASQTVAGERWQSLPALAILHPEHEPVVPHGPARPLVEEEEISDEAACRFMAHLPGLPAVAGDKDRPKAPDVTHGGRGKGDRVRKAADGGEIFPPAPGVSTIGGFEQHGLPRGRVESREEAPFRIE